VGGRRSVEGSDRLVETVVAPGEEVCAIGLYRAAEGGLALDLSPEGRPLRLFRGGAGPAAAALAGDGRTETVVWIVLAALSLALPAAAFVFVSSR
jgi:hypothetical protein